MVASIMEYYNKKENKMKENKSCYITTISLIFIFTETFTYKNYVFL